jgi:hypothetical protein
MQAEKEDAKNDHAFPICSDFGDTRRGGNRDVPFRPNRIPDPDSLPTNDSRRESFFNQQLSQQKKHEPPNSFCLRDEWLARYINAT